MIDNGEAWASVIGCKAILSKEVEKITDGQKREVADLSLTIRKRVKSLFNESIIAPQLPSIDYFKTLDLTSTKMDVPQIVAMIRPIPSDDQLLFMTVASRIYSTLANSIPKSGNSNASGPEALMPNDVALLGFNELYAALDNVVSYVFGAMSEGSLMPQIAHAVKAVFPTLADDISHAIKEYIDAKGKGKYFEIPWKLDIGLKQWAEVPFEPPIPAPPPDNTQQSEGKKDDVETDTSSMTPTERVESGK